MEISAHEVHTTKKTRLFMQTAFCINDQNPVVHPHGGGVCGARPPRARAQGGAMQHTLRARRGASARGAA